ncbi:hypothetical protein PGTUg99_018994 [Puccinia graminis f. sp. tritici]|uniref:Uncharacterized protein n=1 Tax=Puccinia graminis f. sp. tritici TaxID=56615 RepID=A0A5B0QGU3_PUCGR|nr:hypothetical protein PGTUg99_018994 [Puccinia graminis f. sp. tritici]
MKFKVNPNLGCGTVEILARSDNTPPIESTNALTIAGSDSSGGAGMQAGKLRAPLSRNLY